MLEQWAYACYVHASGPEAGGAAQAAMARMARAADLDEVWDAAEQVAHAAAHLIAARAVGYVSVPARGPVATCYEDALDEERRWQSRALGALVGP